MAQKRIADRRLYGRDAYGRRVLVAVKGQPIPDGYEVESADKGSGKRSEQKPSEAKSK